MLDGVEVSEFGPKAKGRLTSYDEGSNGSSVDFDGPEDQPFRREMPPCEEVGRQGKVVYPEETSASCTS